MKSIYHYTYFHLYDFVQLVRRVNARESATLYISAIVFFITLPLFVFVVDRLFSAGVSKGVFLTFGLFYAFLIYKLNFQYFRNPKRWKLIISKYQNEDKHKRKAGHIAVITVFFLSIVAGFALLFVIL